MKSFILSTLFSTKPQKREVSSGIDRETLKAEIIEEVKADLEKEREREILKMYKRPEISS